MAENENVVVEEQQETTQKVSFGAKIKEWFRKQIVSLKRAPQRIPLVCLTACSVFYLLAMYNVGVAILPSFSEKAYVPTAGLCTFISTLLSILVLVSFLNAFPKRKKPNIVFIVLVFVMIAAIIAFDLWYYFQMENLIANKSGNMQEKAMIAQPYVLAHVIMLGVAAVIFALLPVYKKLINKIDTSVKLESTSENMEKIDIED